MKIRTRYAPSPTGYFHIGGARTALFNYLFAKHNEGTFIVRIEDTDIERNVDGGIESQLQNLKWLNIFPNESILNPGKHGPYKQSDKIEKYKKLAFSLVEQGKAYYCFCSKEELDTQREEAIKNGLPPKYSRKCLNLSKEEIAKKIEEKIPFVIRLKIEDNINIEWDDLIRGHMSVPTSALTDPVILKSNGYPMYNFAVVIDDYDMDITHVLRGEEHISNTPYQIAIKKALGYDSKKIEYGHLSIIVNEEGKKLSKRDHNLKQFIEDYKTLGYPPAAIINFLSLLGWSPEDNKEIMTLSEIVNKFSINRVSKSPAFFDIRKMNWISNEYFKSMSDNEYLQEAKKYLNSQYKNLNNLDNILLLFKNNIFCFNDLNNNILENFLTFSLSLNEDEEKFLKNDLCKKVILEFENQINENIINSEDDVKKIIDIIKLKTGAKGKDLFMPIRISATSKTHGSELAKMIWLINKDTILDNIKKLKSLINI